MVGYSIVIKAYMFMTKCFNFATIPEHAEKADLGISRLIFCKRFRALIFISKGNGSFWELTFWSFEFLMAKIVWTLHVFILLNKFRASLHRVVISFSKYLLRFYVTYFFAEQYHAVFHCATWAARKNRLRFLYCSKKSKSPHGDGHL